MLEGRLLMRMPGGDQTYEAGQAFYWGPGHTPFALTDCAYVDFSPDRRARRGGEAHHRRADRPDREPPSSSHRGSHIGGR